MADFTLNVQISVSYIMAHYHVNVKRIAGVEIEVYSPLKMWTGLATDLGERVRFKWQFTVEINPQNGIMKPCLTRMVIY